MRHRLLGNCAQSAVQPACPPAQGQSRSRARHAGEGQIGRRQDPARARLCRCSAGLLFRSRQGSPWPARASLSQRDGRAGRALPRRRRGPDRLRDHAERRSVAQRQDLCQPAQGRRHSGADLQAPAAASRHSPLSDPPLRLPADRRERVGRGQAIRRDRAGGTARAAHAVAHFHAGRLLEGVDRIERRIGARREGRQGTARPAARHGLSGLRPSPGRARQRRPRGRGRDDRGHGLQSERSRRTVCRRGQSGPLHGRARRLERRRRLAGTDEPVRLCRCAHPFCTRAGRGAFRQSRRLPGATSRSSPNCTKSCGRPRTSIGRSKWTSSGRSRPPGC